MLECRADIGVSELATDPVHVGPGRESEGGEGVPTLVGRSPFDPSIGERLVPRSMSKVAEVDGPSLRCLEDQL